MINSKYKYLGKSTKGNQMIKQTISDLAYFLRVTKVEERILYFIKDNSGTTNKEISTSLNVDKYSLSTSLNEMKDAGYLLKSFKNRIAHWSLNKDHYSYGLIT